MNRVITINLNGNAYQLDEDGYNALRAYLDAAQTRLADNPDRAEIMADLEQAIAEKCQKVLGPNKTVVSAAEVDRVITEMGPVESGADAGQAHAQEEHGAGDKKTTERGAPKRLYQIREGSMVSGICKGIAAYFDIDVTIVRLIFVVLAIVSKGVWILAYIVLMFVIPYAHTSEERAAAHGQPFNAQELIDQAKRNYAGFKDGKEWGRHWQRQHREWTRHWRQQSRWWGRHVQQNAGYATQVGAAVMAPIFGIIGAACFVLLALALISLTSSGAIFGWPLPPGIPLWAGLLGLVLLYLILVAPLGAARHAAHYTAGSWHGAAAWGWTLQIWFTVFFFWLAYEHVPEVRTFVHDLPTIWNNLVR